MALVNIVSKICICIYELVFTLKTPRLSRVVQLQGDGDKLPAGVFLYSCGQFVPGNAADAPLSKAGTPVVFLADPMKKGSSR